MFALNKFTNLFVFHEVSMLLYFAFLMFRISLHKEYKTHIFSNNLTMIVKLSSNGNISKITMCVLIIIFILLTQNSKENLFRPSTLTARTK